MKIEIYCQNKYNVKYFIFYLFKIKNYYIYIHSIYIIGLCKF